MNRTFVIGLAALAWGPTLFAQPAPQVGSFTTIDAPGGGTGSGQGTYLTAINASGVITGYYTDANYANHGFLRNSDGSFVIFTAPDSTYMNPLSINATGAITGYYDDEFAGHGFVRSPGGTITTFDPAGSEFTQPNSINASGIIAGYYYDASFVTHAFIRTANGTITTIDPPGASGAQAFSINATGDISGCYTDAISIGHGFLRTSSGTLTTFDFPGNPGGCDSNAINAAGEIAGSAYLPIPGNPFGGNNMGFLRTTDGTLTEFSAGQYPPCCVWTYGTAINASGLITGNINDGYGINHGYVRLTNGNIITLDDPNVGTFQGTTPTGISASSKVIGNYNDSNSAAHGFIWTP